RVLTGGAARPALPATHTRLTDTATRPPAGPHVQPRPSKPPGVALIAAGLRDTPRATRPTSRANLDLTFTLMLHLGRQRRPRPAGEHVIAAEISRSSLPRVLLRR